ncbi:cell division suppressor protein YneA [Sporohalobacter salinus]|uniref:cell division suppressor protein YneA n=1 Tax=Sporohalobacter salinus TaxID=1494606 RepID=UPI00195FE4A0|nr:LysM peptidoglycan-binding domain-containing protein [Sporohalobacter salinus]MBM7624130.1 nucleoid-associated protein YgaU [Sporohalobacter salinus]
MKKRVINYYPADKEKKSSRGIFFNLTLIFICLILLITISYIASSNSLIEIKEIKIETGDSLWKIVKEHYSTEINIRKKIYQIRKINKLSSAKLYPGQTLKIPQT